MKHSYLILISFSIAVLFINCKYSNSTTKLNIETKNTLLKDYVATPDTAYRYELRNSIQGEGYKTYVLYLQSQRWLTEKEVKNPLWWHWLTIVVPDKVESNIGMLGIGGGDRATELPEDATQMIIQSALFTNSVTAELHNIPNQPVEFIKDDFGPRVEDELIAYGWKKYLDGGAKEEDVEWLARLPMTKAAVKAMDAISDFCKNDLDIEVNEYTVMGGSKRGWTTWTTAVVDERVVAIAPVVIDLLNAIPSFDHHWKAYGAWAPAVGDYVREGIMELQDSPAYEQLMKTTEPYSFIDQLTLPKFIINASGDQFFLPDSWQFYWDDLKGEKHLRYIANADHSLGGSDALKSYIAFYNSVIKKTPRPQFDWSVEESVINIKTKSEFQPDSIWLWKASNPNARDFRLETIGSTWEKEVIEINSEGVYNLSVEEPEEGWTAYFGEIQFSNGESEVPFKFTTGIVVNPKTLPFPPFKAKN